MLCLLASTCCHRGQMPAHDFPIYAPVDLRGSPSAGLGKHSVLNKSLRTKLHLGFLRGRIGIVGWEGKRLIRWGLQFGRLSRRMKSTESRRCVFGLPEKELGSRKRFSCYPLQKHWRNRSDENSGSLGSGRRSALVSGCWWMGASGQMSKEGPRGLWVDTSWLGEGQRVGRWARYPARRLSMETQSCSF